MGKIRILADNIRNKIAAGEVVERPASVVKELVENSIDAGAKNIEIIIMGGGNSSIQVIDDGEGLSSQYLQLAFQRYTTSKIRQVDDLLRIATLGFRGEALASIASVAKVRAASRVSEEKEGHKVVITDGRISEIRPEFIQKGTSITIHDLFFSIPARRKFLKSPRVESRHIMHTIQRFVLCYPEIGFRFKTDEREIFYLKPESLESRIKHLYDPTYQKNILEVKFEKGEYRVSGFIGNLNFVRKRRGGQFLFLNRRYIINSLLNSAVYSAYQSLLDRGEYPFYVINLSVPIDQVDVNVHPMKIEVRFRDEWRVYHVLKSAVTLALQDILRTIPDFSINSGKSSEPIFPPQSKLHFTQKKTESRPIYGRESIDRAKDYVKHISTSERELSVPDLGKIWQIHEKYIVSQIRSGLVIIDQHVAHERVLYEQALQAIEGKTLPSQTLLFPQVIELSSDDFSILLELFSFLEKIGFRMKEFGKNTLLIEGVPSEMDWGNERKILQDIIDYYQTHQKEYTTHQEALAASYACHAAIKAGDELTPEEMQTLVDRLFATKHPYYCPHGRPIIINLSLEELDRRFERI